MKRLLLLVVVVLAGLAPATGSASTPCRDRIYNDWYPDGKIKTTYPIACYRDALKHIHGDALVYSSLSDDIRSAMQAALARLHGHARVPAQVGRSGPPASRKRTRRPATSDVSLTTDKRPPAGPTASTGPMTTLAVPTAAGGGSSVPVPLLVLGGLALLLVAAGTAGVVAERRRG
ncbi:MAG TPA: hypothetical protein VE982_06015 [Gaiellaceae bacterium]|nr:hypothetical protein [Gaiellaceae bacterium]